MRRFFLAVLTAAALTSSIAASFAQVPPPVPALPDSERRISYTVTASTCACSLGANLQIYGDGNDFQNWVEVWLNGNQVSYNDPIYGWVITSPSNPSLATAARPITDAVMTFNNAQTGTVQIIGARRPRRVSQFAENQGIAARNVNQVITDIIAMLREVWDKINDVTGRVPRAPPGETLATLPPAASRANMGAGFDSNGNLVPVVAVPSGSFSAGSGITFTGTNPTTISTAAQAGANALLPSRASAISTDLHLFNVVQTGGYANPGDGGHAFFKNVGTSPFIDSFVTTASITAGSGCTNATYYGVSPTGGTGTGLVAVITVSGGAVTAANFTYSPGNAYSVGDVLTLPSATIGCSNASLTFTAVSTPLGSFTDSVGTHWQIVNQGIVYAQQFGAFPSAADNFNSLKAAHIFAKYTTNGYLGGGGYTGGRVFIANGAYAVCGTGSESLEIPEGVNSEMPSNQAATLNFCTSFSSTVPMMVLCDPNWQYACFGAQLLHYAVYASRSGSASSNIPVIYSNNDQDFGGLHDTYIYGGLRQCFAYEKGYGGAATFTLDHVYCGTASSSAQIRIGSTTTALNVGTTAVRFIAPALGGPSSGGTYQTASGILIYGGYDEIEGGHAESMAVGIEVNNGGSIAAGQVWIKNFNAGSGGSAPTFVGTIQLDSTNTPGNTVLEMIQTSSSGYTINNAQSSGISWTGNIRGPLMCVNAGACSAAVP